MTIFVIGFVLSTSGWSMVIAYGLQGRPSYSVCGQEMCSCLPTTPAEPHCPLCVADDDDNASGPANTEDTTPTRKRLPKTDRFDSISNAVGNSGACVFLSFVFAERTKNNWSLAPIATISMMQDRAPRDPPNDLPTPPPRA